MPKCDVNNHAVQSLNSCLLYVCMSVTLDMSVMPGKDCMTENPGCSILHASRELLAAWRHHEVLHSKNEGMKHIPTQYDSYTFSFHTMGPGMKEASFCFKQQYDDHAKNLIKVNDIHSLNPLFFSVPSPL